MCLHKVYETYEPNDNIVVAYKVFRVLEGKIFNDIIHRHLQKRLGDHYKAIEKRNLMGSFDKKPYNIGFHAFLSMKDALSWRNMIREKVFEVIVWDIRAKGQQPLWSTDYTVVAKNMRIMRQLIKGVDYV